MTYAAYSHSQARASALITRPGREQPTLAPGSMRPDLRPLAAGELVLGVGRVRLDDHLRRVRRRELRVVELLDGVLRRCDVPHLGRERRDLLRVLAVQRLE